MALVGPDGVLRFGVALTRAVHLARLLGPAWRGQGTVGILLPVSTTSALVNLAALLCGKTVVNLDTSLSEHRLALRVGQCAIRTVVTSRSIVSHARDLGPVATVLLEDMAPWTRRERLVVLALAWLSPVRVLERTLQEAPVALDDVATILFSQGTTGAPRGARLTHRNIGTNVQQLGQVLNLEGDDRMLGVLPFSQAFGFTAAFAFPLTRGIGVVYPAPALDAGDVGTLATTHRVSCVIASPVLLRQYVDVVPDAQFDSLRHVLAVAASLPNATAAAFAARFGIQPFVAYGCTECSPWIAVNRPDYRAPGYHQVGQKRGSLGHPLPGISLRIVDPVGHGTLPVGTPGLLLVRGPNVMKGYLGPPHEQATHLPDGWFATGDIATLDRDGFLVFEAKPSAGAALPSSGLLPSDSSE